jgi:hypothetical protein
VTEDLLSFSGRTLGHGEFATIRTSFVAIAHGVTGLNSQGNYPQWKPEYGL